MGAAQAEPWAAAGSVFRAPMSKGHVLPLHRVMGSRKHAQTHRRGHEASSAHTDG